MGTIAHTEQELELERTLREAGARHGDRLVLLCSFQKEESVLVDAVLQYAPETRIVTIDTGVLFEETLKTWKAFEDRFGVKVEVFDASNPDNPWSGPEHCCSVAKVEALERSLADAEGWITGIRREQGETRANTELVEIDAKRGIHKYNPLASWTDRDLWRRIADKDLPYNPLHDQGYESIGCEPCTKPGAGREGRWAGTGKTECGLHDESVLDREGPPRGLPFEGPSEGASSSPAEGSGELSPEDGFSRERPPRTDSE